MFGILPTSSDAKHIKGVSKRFYVTDITAHVFRHNYTCTLCKNGVNVKEVQKLFAHANVSVTLDIYTHFSEDKEKLSTKKNFL